MIYCFVVFVKVSAVGISTLYSDRLGSRWREGENEVAVAGR